jgi:hypothetical protein
MLNLGQASYQLFQNVSTIRLLPEIVKIKIYNAIILLVVSYCSDTWSVTYRRKCDTLLSMLKSRILRRIFRPKGEKQQDEAKCIMRGFTGDSECSPPDLSSAS